MRWKPYCWKDPPTYKMTYTTGKLKKLMENEQYSTKGKTTYQRIKNFDETLLKCSTITKQLDTQVNWKLTMLFDKTIGGPDYEHLSKTMCKAVAYANSSKSTNFH